MSMRVYRKGEVIFRQGDAADTMFDVLFGSVAIFAGYGTDYEKKLTELTAGDTFGEMGMIDHEPRSATAVAMTNQTQIDELREGDLINLFRKNPSKVIAILRMLSRRLRNLTRDYVDVCKTAVDVVAIEETPESVTEETREKVLAKAEHFGQMKDEAYT